MHFIFILFIAITTFHILSFSPPNQVYLNVSVCNSSLLMMTLVWVKNV